MQQANNDADADAWLDVVLQTWAADILDQLRAHRQEWIFGKTQLMQWSHNLVQHVSHGRPQACTAMHVYSTTAQYITCRTEPDTVGLVCTADTCSHNLMAAPGMGQHCYIVQPTAMFALIVWHSLFA
jgi:hypothetical protein